MRARQVNSRPKDNLKTEVVDVRMMLVPDIRLASSDAAARAIAACERMSRRNAHRFLYDEFALGDRRRSAQRGASTPQDIADELWDERQDAFDLLQFPEDFLTRPNAGDAFDLPSGEVEVGGALMDVGGLLTVGQIRVGGRGGDILEVGSVSRARYLEALSRCHRAGRVHIPDDETCDTAVSAFNNYREELQTACARLAAQRTPDARRRNAITSALLRKALLSPPMAPRCVGATLVVAHPARPTPIPAPNRNSRETCARAGG